ncbi:MAG TPA: hypothetical protein PKN29_00430 [Candidatus Ozemobacteraceae bacterium]|nr:hypothetical protein [Candidatus Ozemobacteraceae bacterium]
MRIYKAVLLAFLLATFLFQTGSQKALAADITFDSFEAAEAAAKKRAEEYQKKMQEHIKNVNEQWEKQQKDLGADSSSPDISKITTRQDGQKSSDTDASKSLENAVNSSINRLKDEMVSKAGPTSTGFAGGAAGYQWSVKFKNGKYVLSDSYNEAEFNTGKKKEAEAPATPPAPTEPENVASGEDNDSDAGSAAEPSTEPAATAATPPETTPAVAPPETPSATTADSKPATPATTTATKPATPEEPAKPLTGVDPAPVKLPPPSIRMVIQHPTDFSEEVFASNANSETTANYRLDKFKIPEDTRIKIAVEVGEDVNPEDVSMVVTDDQGDTAPVSAAKLKNYRHMFRVPSEDQYSASVYVNNRKAPGGQQKKILQVAIPVGKVDFESRTIDNQRGSKSGTGAGNMSSSDTSSSGGNESVNHSSFGKPQAVDLSDLYSDPAKAGATAAGGVSDNSAGSSSAGSSSPDSAASSGSDTSSGDTGSSGGQSYSGSESATGSNGSGEIGYAGSAQGTSSDDMAGNTENGETSAPETGDNQETAATEENSISSGSGSDSNQQTADSGIRYSTADGDSSQGSEYTSDSAEGSDVAGADEVAGAETSGNAADNENTSGTSGDNQKVKAPGQNAAGNKSATTGKEQGAEEEDPFLLAISLRAEAQKVYQSFDFIDGNTQTSSAIKAGGEVVFSLNMGTDVNPESIQIKLSDGAQEIKGNLKRMGESFAYVFKSPTESAYIEVSGKTSKRSFTYKVGIPVR